MYDERVAGDRHVGPCACDPAPFACGWLNSSRRNTPCAVTGGLPVHRLVLIFGVLVAFAAAGCRGGPAGKAGSQDEDEPKADERVLVEASEAALGSVADYIVASGTVESEAQADIVPEARGMVSRILVDVGDPVHKGQVLALIANPNLEASAERARIELERARDALNTAEQLHGQGAVSDKELADAQAAFRTAQATYEEAMRSQSFTAIKSPIDGIVAIRDCRVGELANGGQRAFEVVDLQHLRVIVNLPERDLRRVHPGQRVLLQSAYAASSSGGPEDGQTLDSGQVRGTVDRVSPVIDPQTGTARVRIAIDPDQTALRPGEYVRARIEVDRHDGVLTIPRRALVWEDGAPIAWKVVPAPPAKKDEEAEKKPEKQGLLARLLHWPGEAKAEGGEQADETPGPHRVVEKAPIEVGYIDPDRVEILGGLKAGDLVVTVGNSNLREHTPVRLPDDPVAPPSDDTPKGGEPKGAMGEG